MNREEHLFPVMLRPNVFDLGILLNVAFQIFLLSTFLTLRFLIAELSYTIALFRNSCPHVRIFSRRIVELTSWSRSHADSVYFSPLLHSFLSHVS